MTIFAPSGEAKLTTTGVKDGTPHITAKAWAFYNTASTHSIKNSYGFSGITDRGAGYCSLEFSVDQANVNWALGVSAGDNHRNNIDGSAHLVDAVHLVSHSGATNTGNDCTRNSAILHGE